MRSLLHLSDVHFGPPHRPEVAAAVVRHLEQRPVDLVLISGDLTQRAKPYQFREARAFVDSLETPILAVPGNHDVPMYRFWERLALPFGAYRKHFDRELEPRFEDDELLVLGFNTAFNSTIKHGRLLPRQIERARQFATGPDDHRCKIAVLHHPLLSVPGFPKDPPTRRAEPFLRVLADAGVDLVLSGHLHMLYQVDARERITDLPRSIHLMQSGTSTSNRGRAGERGLCSSYRYEISDSTIEITALRFSDSTGEYEGLWDRSIAR